MLSSLFHTCIIRDGEIGIRDEDGIDGKKVILVTCETRRAVPSIAPLYSPKHIYR